MKYLHQKHKNQSNESCFIHKNGCYLLYNPELLEAPEASLLKQGILKKADHYQLITRGGRGQAWFVVVSGISAVYRKYMRGGIMARINRQTYMGLNWENGRSIKEWRMLQWMFDKGLPVPRPVAASVCRVPFSFSPLYQAQILVERIPGAQTLDQILTQHVIEGDAWRAIGQCVRRFHCKGVYHDDLNASNILLDAELTIHLIDFDKGALRGAQETNTLWMENNLQRLKRSLLKQQKLHKKYHFTEDNWHMLIAGYEESVTE